MPSDLVPGVYVQEVSGGARPIEAVGTSTAGFVGEAPKIAAHVNQAVPINNWSEFVREFVDEKSSSTPLYQAVYGFFQNGGSRCYVVNVGKGGQIGGGGLQPVGLDLLAQIDEIAIIAAPGYTDAASYARVLEHCEQLEDRVAILDGPEKVADISQLTKVATTGGGDDEPAGAKGMAPRQSAGGYGAVYYPWIKARNSLAPYDEISVPPSGHIAGIWARTDAARGVHKAPANEVVRGALNVTHRLTRAEMGTLNQAGVNCIRLFAREGVLVWGARTLAGSSSEWRYVNVRRLFNMIKESIADSTRWIVFEPNDYTLWKSIRRDVTAFLMGLWRDGALMGRTPEEAFFVKCDEETNPRDVIDQGMVVTLIGIAPVKPAEFIFFRISQYQGGVEVKTEGGA